MATFILGFFVGLAFGLYLLTKAVQDLIPEKDTNQADWSKTKVPDCMPEYDL
jgi:hypothetical protein